MRVSRGARPARSLVALLLAGAVAVACGSGEDAGTTAGPTPSPASPGTASPSASPSSSPTPSTTETAGAAGGVVLGGDDLGVTRLGAPFDEAVEAVRTVLGDPDADPSSTVRCLEASTEVRWEQLVLAEREGRLVGWTSQSRTLQTPSGVTVGTPVSELERLYGDRLERFPAGLENPPTFALEAVGLLGGLSGEDDDAVVESLFTRACSGP